MVHLDLFSGIGGFAYAADQVWDNVEHIFCDNDPFCREVIKKHWPESEVYHDIKEITADTIGKRLEGSWEKQGSRQRGQLGRARQNKEPFLLTGGFPCQPFSAAGLSWNTDWAEAATRLCRMDNGAANRVDRIRALANAIVPQVAIEIMRGMV